MTRKHKRNIKQTPFGGLFIEGTDSNHKPVRIYYTYTSKTRPKCDKCGTVLGGHDLTAMTHQDGTIHYLWECFNCGNQIHHTAEEALPPFRRRVKAYQESLIQGDMQPIIVHEEITENG